MHLSRTLLAVISIVAITVLIAASVAFALGLGLGLDTYHVVPYTHYGLNWNKVTGSVEETQVYEPGRYATGVAHDFLLFPRIYVQIDFTIANGRPVPVVTQDGITLVLDISFQYRIEKNRVLPVYFMFGTGIEAVVTKISRNVLRDVASNYTMAQFISRRADIAKEFNSKLITIMSETAMTSIYDVQLRNVDFPDDIERSFKVIQQTQIELQVAAEIRKKQLYEAETSRLKELYDLETARQKDLYLIETNRQKDLFVAETNRQKAVVDNLALREKELYQAETSRQKSIIDAELRLVLAQRQAAIDLQNAQAQASVLQVSSSASANATELKSRSNINALEYAKLRGVFVNSTELLTYVYLNNLREMNIQTNYMSTTPPLNLQLLKT